MDVLTYSKDEKWIELFEAKRTLVFDENEIQESLTRKKNVILSQLSRRFPRLNIEKWEFRSHVVFVYGKLPKRKLDKISFYELEDLIHRIL